MKLMIVRHGETIENTQGIVQGHLHGTLSELGKTQAKKVADKLKKEKIDYIYSSDLARAADTAKEIAKFHPKTPIKFVKELRERFFGPFQGKKKSDFGLSNKESLSKIIKDEKEKGVESPQDFYNRAKKFLDKIVRKHPKGIVLFVGHNGINKAIINVINKKSPEEVFSGENLDNASISIFEIN